MPLKLAEPQPHVAILRKLDEMIRRDSLWGQRLMGERELAAEFAVPRRTIRRALAQMEAMRLLERRQGAGTFVADRPEDRANRGVSEIAIISMEHFEEGPGWHYKGEMIRGMLAWSRRMDSSCTHLSLDRKEDGERVWDARHMRRFGGFILVQIEDHTLLTHLLKLQRGPVVLLDHIVRDLPVTSVVDGSFAGARAVTRHLLSRGHRRIAFLDCHDRQVENPEKFAGYQAGLADRSLAVDDALVVRPSEPDAGIDLGAFVDGAVDRLLGLADPPTALFAFDDNRAVPAVRALERRGLSAGADLGVAGFGDSAIRRGICDWLTSCRIYPRKMGREALRAALEHTVTDQGRIVIVPNRLYVRRSTAGPRSRRRERLATAAAGPGPEGAGP